MPAAKEDIDVEELAERFYMILSVWLSREEIEEVNRRNATTEYEGLCASHDFCDSNQALCNALESMGYGFHPELCDQLNLAWELAKEHHFQFRK